MKKLRLLLLGLLVAGIVFWLAGKVGGPPDPKYQGRRLSAMLKEFPPDVYTLESGRQVRFVAEDVKGIRHMGTNAIPYLLREMSATDSHLMLIIKELVLDRFNVRIRFDMADYHQYRAADAFLVLGPIGEPAIPELAKLLDNGETSGNAAIALRGTGDKSLPILIQALSHSNVSARASAAVALGIIPASGTVAVPALIRALGDPDRLVRSAAAYALGEIHQEAALAVPALTKCLEDSNTRVRQAVARALKNFGAEAKPALPALLKARDVSVALDRAIMEDAVKAIDPEAAARAGIK